MEALIYSYLRQTNERQRSPESRNKKENDEALVPSSMKNCCSAQCCSSITLLKSTLLLSLLTPALDGLLSTPLLPSRLFGTEFGDASEPGGMKVWNDKGGDKSVRDVMSAREMTSLILTRMSFVIH